MALAADIVVHVACYMAACDRADSLGLSRARALHVLQYMLVASVMALAAGIVVHVACYMAACDRADALCLLRARVLHVLQCMLVASMGALAADIVIRAWLHASWRHAVLRR